jgi:hypothetical protein
MSVPSSALGPPTLSPGSECVTPLDPKEGGQHLLAGEGVKGPNSTGQKAWHPVYSVLDIFHNGEYTSMLYEVFYTGTLKMDRWGKNSNMNKFKKEASQSSLLNYYTSRWTRRPMANCLF